MSDTAGRDFWAGGRRAPGYGVACALVSNLLFGIAIGMILPLVPLRLDMMGEGSGAIGLHAISSSLPIVMMAPFMGRLLTRFGAPRLLIASALIIAAATLGMIVFQGYWPWFALRFLWASGAAIGWVGTEAWINQAAPSHMRSRVLSFYVTTFIGGMALGTPLLTLIGVEGDLPFLVIAGLSVITVIPVLAAIAAAPDFPASEEKRIFGIFYVAPVLMSLGFVMGVADGSAFSLTALFGVLSGLSQEAAITCLTAFLVGGIAFQYPMGWLADKYDRRSIGTALALGSIAIAALLPFALPNPWITWFLFGLIGIPIIGLYAIALGIVGDRFQGAEMGAANAFFVMSFEFGALSGAPLSGFAMELVGPNGLLLVIATSGAIVAAGFKLRGNRWQKDT